MVSEVSTGRLFVKLIVNVPAPAWTRISGGCHVVVPSCVPPFMAEQEAPTVAETQFQPHIGTGLPSGSGVVCLVAVMFTVWADAAEPAATTIVSASAGFFKASLRELGRI